jgi:hypothetical protein
MLDESEVDSVPNSQHIPVDTDTGEIQQQRKPAGKFDILKEFGKMKKTLGDSDYYRILKSIGGVRKSSEFKDTEESRKVARRAYIAMEAFRREVASKLNKFAEDGDIPSFDKWPDNFDGPMVRVAGVLYKFNEAAGNYQSWDETGLGVYESDLPESYMPGEEK